MFGEEPLRPFVVLSNQTLDLEIDLERAANASGRDTGRHGSSLMLAPDRWLWYPAAVPDAVEARARPTWVTSFDGWEGPRLPTPVPAAAAGWPTCPDEGEREP